jgi:diguanylate cyclase (GGDEF)-like protein
MVLVILLGGFLQAFFPGGLWLMALTILGLSARMGLADGEKHGRLSFIGGLVFWVFLQTMLGRIFPDQAATRTLILLEVFVVAAFPALFWMVFLTGTQQNSRELEQFIQSGERQGELKQRLDRMEGESAGLQAESDEWTHLFSVTKSVGQVIREEEMIEVVKETVHTHLKHPAYLLLISHGGNLQVRAQEGFEENLLGGASFSSNSNTLAAWFARQKEPILVDDLRQDGRFPGSMFPFRAVMVLPMWIKETSLGILLVFDERTRAFSRQDFTRTWILCNQLALGVGKALLYERVEELSITDGLTKLYRHRYFQERLDQEMDRARRYGRTMTFLMCDLDHFKRYNDTYGHPEGDEMLKMVSRLMGEHFARPALLARYGGEEFAVLLPDTTRERAVELAVNFRKALESSAPPAAAARKPMTVSIGVASFPSDAQTKRDLVARADLALYRAKNEGRNRVCCYEASMEGQGAKA